MSVLAALRNAMSGITGEARKSALTSKVEGITIDTCMATDTNEFETGIKVKGDWVIVEQYGTSYEKAEKGHEKWVKMVKKGKRDFKSCLEFGF